MKLTMLAKEQYREYATYSREFDELNDTNNPYGVQFWDGDQIIDTFWHETEELQEHMIDEFNGVN